MQLIIPDWPAAANIQAFTTTRAGGVSVAPWNSFNLGGASGDDPHAVEQNRQRLAALLPHRPQWLNQTHGNTVVSATGDHAGKNADGIWAEQGNSVCAVLTADCLPVLLCTRSASKFAAVHCGWRSLAGGVLENCIAAMAVAPDDLLIWFGPAISAQHYEIGIEVYEAFVGQCHSDTEAFSLTRPGHWQADLVVLAKLRLQRLGVANFYGGHWCTYSDPRFFSYRRDGQTGRMATVISRLGVV